MKYKDKGYNRLLIGSLYNWELDRLQKYKEGDQNEIDIMGLFQQE